MRQPHELRRCHPPAGLPVRQAVPETPGFIAQAAQVRSLRCAVLRRAALRCCVLHCLQSSTKIRFFPCDPPLQQAVEPAARPGMGDLQCSQSVLPGRCAIRSLQEAMAACLGMPACRTIVHYYNGQRWAVLHCSLWDGTAASACNASQPLACRLPHGLALAACLLIPRGPALCGPPAFSHRAPPTWSASPAPCLQAPTAAQTSRCRSSSPHLCPAPPPSWRPRPWRSSSSTTGGRSSVTACHCHDACLIALV